MNDHVNYSDQMVTIWRLA